MTRKIYGINEGSQITLKDGSWEGGAIEDLGSFGARHFFSLEEITVASLPAQDSENGFALASADEITGLKAVSPSADIVRNEINAAIRAKYSVDDELQALRTGDAIVAADITSIVAIGKAKMASLGF